MSQDETSKDNSSGWGGAREGAGRPKGSMNASSKERMKIKQALQERIAQHVDRLFNAQMTLAEGATMLFRVEKTEDGVAKKPELITDEDTIKRFIEECGGYDGVMDGTDYYFLTTKLPDNKAIDSMLDRAFGKAEAKLDITSEGESIVQPDEGLRVEFAEYLKSKGKGE